MNFLSDSFSPKLPFRDKFQRNIEGNTRNFFRNKYVYQDGKRSAVNKTMFFSDVRKIEAYIKESKDDTFKARLIYVDIIAMNGGKSLSVKAYPENIIDSLTKKGDFRVKRGLIEPFLKCFEWANKNDLTIPPKLEARVYFWLADKPSWEFNNVPIFIPSGIPGGLSLPLFPDVSYFYYQPESKYTGEGLDWEEQKDLYTASNPITPGTVYFKGADTTQHNSDIRKDISKSLGDLIGPSKVDIRVGNVFGEAFKPLYSDALGNQYLLDLPGCFPWSVRFKMLFLLQGSPTIIKVNERWRASDGSWEDSEEPWIQWFDTFLDSSAYLSITHNHIQILKEQVRDKAIKLEVDTINANNREDTINGIVELVESDGEAINKTLGHDTVMTLSSDRIYQMMYRLVITLHTLNRV